MDYNKIRIEAQRMEYLLHWEPGLAEMVQSIAHKRALRVVQSLRNAWVRPDLRAIGIFLNLD